MKSIKKNFCTIIALYLLILTVFYLLLSVFDLVYRPWFYGVFFTVYTAINVLIAVCAVKFRKVATKTSKIFACIMPWITLLYLSSLVFAFDFNTDKMGVNLIYGMALFFVPFVVSIIIFVTHCKKVWVWIVNSLLLLGVFGILGFVSLLCIFAELMDESKIIKTTYSHDNEHVSITVLHDGGALGGGTVTTLYDNKANFPLISGGIYEREKVTDRGEWPGY